MEAFYIVVLTITAAVLIIILTTVGVAIRKANQDVKWPPTGGRCPDGWEEDSTTAGKCYMPIDMINSGNVTLGTPTDSYAFAADDYNKWLNGDKWRECGTATITITNNNTTLIADNKSDFKYFKQGDKIKIGTEYTEHTVSSVTNNYTKLIIATSIASSGNVKYFGKRISVDFNNNIYKGTTDELTKCARKTWADSNKIQWDGVSNYNKCG